jgi:hypothetical protein
VARPRAGDPCNAHAARVPFCARNFGLRLTRRLPEFIDFTGENLVAGSALNQHGYEAKLASKPVPNSDSICKHIDVCLRPALARHRQNFVERFPSLAPRFVQLSLGAGQFLFAFCPDLYCHRLPGEPLLIGGARVVTGERRLCTAHSQLRLRVPRCPRHRTDCTLAVTLFSSC